AAVADLAGLLHVVAADRVLSARAIEEAGTRTRGAALPIAFLAPLDDTVAAAADLDGGARAAEERRLRAVLLVRGAHCDVDVVSVGIGTDGFVRDGLGGGVEGRALVALVVFQPAAADGRAPAMHELAVVHLRHVGRE